MREIANAFAMKKTPQIGNDVEKIIFAYLDGSIKIAPEQKEKICQNLSALRQHFFDYYRTQVSSPELDQKFEDLKGRRPNCFDRYDFRNTNEVYALPFQVLAEADKNSEPHPALSCWQEALALADELFGNKLVSQYRRHSTIVVAGNEGVIPEIRYSMAAILATLNFLANPPEQLTKAKASGKEMVTNIRLAKGRVQTAELDGIIIQNNRGQFNFWDFLNGPKYGLLEIKTKFRVQQVRSDQSLAKPIPDDLRQINRQQENIILEWHKRSPDKDYTFPDYLLLLYLRFPAVYRTFEIPFDKSYLSQWAREIKIRQPDSPQRHYLLKTICAKFRKRSSSGRQWGHKERPIRH